MVALRGRAIAVFIVLTAIALNANAQQYDVSDTVTEYPMKGTYYHDRFEGRKTACGEIFDQNLFTAAHWKIKMGTYVMVTNKKTGLQVIVKVNDRCPRRGVLDMSHRAANAIGIKGAQPVTVRLLPEGYEELCAAQDGKFDPVSSRMAKKAPKTPKQQEPIDSDSTALPASKETSGHASPNMAATPIVTLYNLMLGPFETHGEAFEALRKLSDDHQDRASIETVDENSIIIVLDVNLSKKKAEALRQSLRRTFDDCQIAPVK